MIDEIWSADEQEAFAFAASCLFPEDNSSPYIGGLPSPEAWQAGIHNAVSTIREFHDLGARPGDLLDDACRRKKSHSIADAVTICSDLLRENPSLLNLSLHGLDLLRIAADLRASEPYIKTPREASRLRDSRACDDLLHEVMVIAAYARRGFMISMTDVTKGKGPECKVSIGSVPPVNIECKRKTIDTLKSRGCQDIFERISENVLMTLRERGLHYDIRVHSRFDPDEVVAEKAHSLFSELLFEGNSHPAERSNGNVSVSILPEPIVFHDNSPMLFVPKGYDFADYEMVSSTSKGNNNAIGFAWKTLQRWRWIKSAINTIKNTRQLAQDEPSIVYLAVPPGSDSVVSLRVDILAHEIQQLFTHDCRRVSMVVVTGQAYRSVADESGKPVAVSLRVHHRVVDNPNANVPIPHGFEVFGREFTR